jgi:inner membrane protein
LDNITHTLTGLMLARAGVGKSVPRAGLLMMLAANAPDVDVVSWLGGPVTYLEYHRWFTHSLAAAPLMAAIVVVIARAASRGRPFPWIRAFVAATVGVASHLALDWTNIYGIRLLLPFSPDWLRLDINAIVDLWIWALFLLAIAAPALAKLVSSEIGATPGTGRGWAIFALLALSGYEYGRYLAHDRAVAVLNARIYDGATPVRVAAFPEFANPLRWRGLVETGDAYRVFALSLAEGFDPSAGAVFFKGLPNEATLAASKTLIFQRFLAFSPLPLWRTVPASEPEGATQVDVFDMRFGDPRHPAFVTTAVVDRSNKVVRSGFSFGGAPAR